MDVCKYKKKHLNMFHVSIMNHYVLDETKRYYSCWLRPISSNKSSFICSCIYI